jgi:hypothetical protein
MYKESDIIKLMNVFVDKNKVRALITALVIDDLHQDFMIELVAKESTTTLRLFPMTDPKKTDGVKTALGLVARFVLYMSPNARMVRTNIEQFISKKISHIQKLNLV